MKVAIITGASGGIGEAIANKLAERKHNLLLVARNAEKLARQCKQLAEKFDINAHSRFGKTLECRTAFCRNTTTCFRGRNAYQQCRDWFGRRIFRIISKISIGFNSAKYFILGGTYASIFASNAKAKNW
nr:SDR family NAD(P)-dependent oxidoreductase [uncultured Sunxiuqinia sp.]